MQKNKKEIKYEDEITLHLPIKLKKEQNPQYKLCINQIPINFPFKPYPNQIKYMEKVIEALNSKEYAALESPTGSGKTLCLLTSVLGWVRINQSKNNFKGKIFYATRTHSQMNGIIKELNKTNYDPITSIVCSRDVFCIHEEMKQLYKKNQLNEMCKICNNNFQNIDHSKIINLKNYIIEQIETILKNNEKKDIDLEVQLSEFKENIEKYINAIYKFLVSDITYGLTNLKEILDSNNQKDKNIKIREELIQLNTKIGENNNQIIICGYYNNTINLPKIDYNNLNIESMCKKGKENYFCPYYYNIKKAKSVANLIILPYQYILNPYMRKILKIDVEDSIVILDEGHNIIEVLENVSSTSINYYICQDIQNLLQRVIDSSDKTINEIDDTFNFQSYNLVINIMKHLGKKIRETEIPNLSSQKIYVKNTLFLNLDELKDFFYIPYDPSIIEKFQNINNENNVLNNPKDKLMIFLQNFLTMKKKNFLIYQKKELKNKETHNNKKKLESFDDLINFLSNFQNYIMFKNEEETSSYFFVLKANPKNNKRNLKIECISPLKNFNTLKKSKLRSLILSSGTLTPINFFESQLNTSFKIQLKNSNLIHPSHIKFDLICSYLNTNFNLRYKEFKNQEEKDKNEKMIYKIGMIVLNLIKRVNKGGILIFFSSYEKMNKYYVNWLDNQIIKEIEKYKKVNIDSKEFRKSIENFTEDLNSVLFTVARGINSEGIDFSDDYGRMVICIGIPFPDISDPKVYMKKKMLNDNYKEYCNKSSNIFINNAPLSGAKWYVIEAMKTTNQCLGRIIRHIHDYGCLICIDSRFKEHIDLFSDWLKTICQIRYFDYEYEFQKYLNVIQKFYEDMSIEKNNKLDLVDFNLLGQKKERIDDDDLFDQVKCPVCFSEDLKILYRAKCNHILCINCWNYLFNNNNKCPLCRKIVNKDELVKENDFFFNN